MSVLIKGMKMPKSCFSCQLKEEGFCNLTNELVNELVVDIYRDSDCPLVELPEKHGRLIDQEEVSKMITNPYEWQEVMKWVIDAPTVIEAEDE